MDNGDETERFGDRLELEYVNEPVTVFCVVCTFFDTVPDLETELDTITSVIIFGPGITVENSPLVWSSIDVPPVIDADANTWWVRDRLFKIFEWAGGPTGCSDWGEGLTMCLNSCKSREGGEAEEVDGIWPPCVIEFMIDGVWGNPDDASRDGS